MIILLSKFRNSGDILKLVSTQGPGPVELVKLINSGEGIVNYDGTKELSQRDIVSTTSDGLMDAKQAMAHKHEEGEGKKDSLDLNSAYDISTSKEKESGNSTRRDPFKIAVTVSSNMAPTRDVAPTSCLGNLFDGSSAAGTKTKESEQEKLNCTRQKKKNKNQIKSKSSEDVSCETTRKMQCFNYLSDAYSCSGYNTDYSCNRLHFFNTRG